MITQIERYWKCCLLYWLFPGIFTIVAPTLTIQKLYFNYPIVTWCFVLTFIVSLAIYARLALARVMPLLADRQVGNRIAILVFPATFMLIVGAVIGSTLKHLIESMLA